MLYGEGRKDEKFLNTLIDLKKFKDHTTPPWSFITDHASGGSPKTILERCRHAIAGRDFDLVICFIDRDVLKGNYPKSWEKEIEALENRYENINIFWHIENLEDEIHTVLGGKKKGKTEMNRIGIMNIQKFVNSKYWKKLLLIIKKKENSD